jgi:hypothetical protein
MVKLSSRLLGETGYLSVVGPSATRDMLRGHRREQSDEEQQRVVER